MRNMLIILLCLAAGWSPLHAQDIRTLNKFSYYTYIYQMPADSIFRLQDLDDDYEFDHTMAAFRLVDSFPTKAKYQKQLPVGHYFFVAVTDRDIRYMYELRTNLIVAVLPDYRRNKLVIRDKDGQYVTDAIVHYRKKTIRYDAKSKVYPLPYSNEDGRLLTIEARGEKIGYDYTTDARDEDNGHRARLRSIKPLPDERINGYIVFNKPKYLPHDTVKLKAYILHKGNKPYTDALRIRVVRSGYGSNSYTTLAEGVKPQHAGSYSYQFVLGDSFEMDMTYRLAFIDPASDRVLAEDHFNTEDYLLNKYTYSFRTEQSGYNDMVTDTIRMTAQAKDANGMNVYDATIRVTGIASSISTWYADDECVPDTLFIIERRLSTTGPTKLTYPVDWLPKAGMYISLHADFINAAHEHQYEQASVQVDRASRKIDVRHERDSVYADYIVDGRSVPGSGVLEISYQEEAEPSVTKAISYPYRMKVDNLVDDYTFKMPGTDTLEKSYEPRSNNYAYGPWSRNDTAIFLRPMWDKAPMFYTLYHGERIVSRGMITDQPVVIRDHTSNEYELVTQIQGRDEAKAVHTRIYMPKNRLHVTLTQSTQTYPGKTDSVTVKVSDLKGHPVRDADVTALSYTTEFNREPYVEGLNVYGRRYEGPALRESQLERIDDVDLTLPLGRCPYWIQRAHLDTMLYYQLIYSHEPVQYHLTPAPESEAQFAPFIFDHGQPVKTQMVYVDGRLAYYEGASEHMPYSIPVTAGVHNIAIRTRTRMLHLDSLSFHDRVKTDLIIQYDSLIAHSDSMPPDLRAAEIQLLENNFIFYKVQRSDQPVYFWQRYNRLVFTFPPSYARSGTEIFALIGPLGYTPVTFYQDHTFHIDFDPERHYAFSFSPQAARLERHDMFRTNYVRLQENTGTYALRFGELIYAHPVPDTLEPASKMELYLVGDMHSYNTGSGLSTLDLHFKSDSTVRYLRVYRTDSVGYDNIYRFGGLDRLNALSPGVYDLMMITASGHYAIQKGVVVPPSSTCRVTLQPASFHQPFSISHLMKTKHLDSASLADSALIYMPASDGESILGRVTNESGDAILRASIYLADSTGRLFVRRTIPDVYGYYTFPAVAPGVYTMVFSDGVHLSRTFTRVIVRRGQSSFIPVQLRFEKIRLKRNELHEVEILEYKSPLIDKAETKVSYEIVSMSVENAASVSPGVTQTDLSEAISKVPGVVMKDETQYIVNGKPLKGQGSGAGAPMPASEMKQVSVTGAISAKYGDVNADIVTYQDVSPLRKAFQDYAYWQPDLVTDRNGEAKFTFKYPDNVTSWRSYALAMTRRHQAGAAYGLTKSYKDCIAELAMPKFLIAGDTSTAAIKITDFAHKPMHLRANFIWDGKKIQENALDIKDVLTDEVSIAVSPGDTRPEIKGSFNIVTDNFGDGEEKSIPLLPKGTEETRGSFAMLHGDTVLILPIDSTLGAVTVRAQGDLLDVLLDEIDHVRAYPYWCMEQTASRLIMLTMLEKINASLGKPFKLQKEKESCIEKLAKGQLFDGTYGWWEYSPRSVRITTYVLSALAKANATGRVNVNDAYRYLDAALPLMTRDEQLSTLELFAETNHDPSLAAMTLRRLAYDSLTLYQQLQYMKVELQLSNTDTLHHWDRIVTKKQRTIFGGSYWGDDSWYWYSNRTAETVLAYQVAELRGDQAVQQEIIQYFLETRSHNGWRNTAESAKIVSAILPKVLSDRIDALRFSNVRHASSSAFNIDGVDVKAFPYQNTFTPSGSSLSISKKGGGPIYFTAYQKVFNPAPLPVHKDFDISTSFNRSGSKVSTLHAGETAEITVEINTHKYCEYLMITVPIPAGCTYGAKPQAYGYTEVHREYFKDRVVIFCEAFQPGHQEFHIPIESRYRGSYTVNPAKVELMYFPTFFGRNEGKRIEIK